MCYLNNGIVFVGSSFGDSQLLQLATAPNEQGEYLQERDLFVPSAMRLCKLVIANLVQCRSWNAGQISVPSLISPSLTRRGEVKGRPEKATGFEGCRNGDGCYGKELMLRWLSPLHFGRWSRALELTLMGLCELCAMASD